MKRELQRMAARLAEELRARSLTVAVAESCTGGLLSDLITDRPGISQSFTLGVVSYSDDSKVGVLGLDGGRLAAEGAVSGATAAAMAGAVRRLGAADVGVGITGIAGPSGGTGRKPVGLVYVGIETATGKVCREFHLNGTRREIKKSAVLAAMELALEIIDNNKGKKGFSQRR